MGQQGPRLRRQLGLISTIAVALGAIIGAGVFVVLGQAAGLAGGALPLAILLAAIVAVFNGLSAAQLGVNYPLAGGTYEFGYRLLAPIIGFAAGWLFLLQAVTAGAAFTLTFVNYLQPLAPTWPLRAVAIALATLAVLANLVGIRLLERINNLLVAIKVGALVLFVAVGLTAVSLQRWPPIRPSLAGLLNASALFFFAFSGFARPVTIAEEVRDPARNLPRGVLAGISISAVLYIAVASVALALVGADALAISPAPLRDALGPTGQAWAQTAISIGALVATSSVLFNEIWGVSRLAFAMARRGDLPRLLSQLSPNGIPRWAVLILGGITILLTATLDLGPALAAASLSLLIYYGLTNLAALWLRPEQRLYPAVVSLAGLVACGVLAASLPAQALIGVGIALAAGLAYFALRHRGHWPARS